MNTSVVSSLNSDFSLSGDNHSLQFKLGKGDIPVVEITNPLATASISLQGGARAELGTCG